MPDGVTELRLAWMLLIAVSAGALLPPADGPGVPITWGLFVLLGSLVAFRGASAERARKALAELVSRRAARLQAMVVLALLAAASVIFSASAALFLASGLAAVTLFLAARNGRAAGRLVDQMAALGGALALVLIPLELVLRLPPVSAQLGLPGERARREAAYDRLWERNIFRLRSPYERVARRPGVARVLALGDSFTWGLYIPSSDSTWPALLEPRLPGPVEVMNMGQRGWTTYNEAEFLTRLGWQFDPDLVLVQFYVNDAYESTTNLAHEEGRRIYLLPAQFWQGYIRTSALSSLVSKAVNGLFLGLLFREADNADRYRDQAAGWSQMRAALRQMADSSRARKVPIALILYPDLLAGEWTTESHPGQDIHRKVADEARAAGFAVLDLTDAFARQGGNWKRWWATPYDAHPNVAAHTVAAAAIAEFIKGNGMLQMRERGS